ncbi:metal-dependent hydrolase [Cytobacillus sp. FJAT-54145]|uniref:Metal-dependent hydrolase n=1 Tax=Cytobacillus spartinae TaxID=3299023 RepID=A0ABW6K8L5_9BACI
MDSITHTLFGLALYGTVDKADMSRKTKAAYLITTVGASQIPDIDVISKLWDNEGLYQMWHRGITHSIFLTPIWALLFYFFCLYFLKVKDKRLFYLGLLAVFIHNTSDLFNAWGTGYLEPFSPIRITFGTISIVDFVFWLIFAVAFLLSRRNKVRTPFYFRMAWCFIILHLVIQTSQGYILHREYKVDYDQVALSANFIPWTFSVITKKDNTVTIYDDNLFKEKEALYVLNSKEDAELETLFKQRPEAKTLFEWSPFVVIVDDDKQLGVYDPRFYRNGQSFLFEYIEKNSLVE